MEKTQILKISFLAFLLTIDGINCGLVYVTNGCHFRINAKYAQGAKNGGITIERKFQVNSGKTFIIRDIGNTKDWRVWVDQGVPHASSLAEFSFDPDGKLWYNISVVDGYTLPVTMSGMKNSGGNCRQVTCKYNINNCPEGADARKIKRGNQVISCQNLNRNNDNTAYVNSLRQACPKQAYTWSQDDLSGMRDCMKGNEGLKIQFC